MRIDQAPKKLKYDGLSDVIVNITFEPEYSKQALQNKIEKGLSEHGFKVMRYSLNGRKEQSPSLMRQFLATEEYKIIVEDDRLVFNIIEGYTGWLKYNEFINLVLNLLPNTSFNNVSVQYVSYFKEISIFEYLDFGMNLNHLTPLMGSELKFRYADDSRDVGTALVDVTLLNNQLIPRQEADRVSCINIRVRSEAGNHWNKDKMLSNLQMVHKVEWEAFISLFKKSFFDLRGGIYE